MATNLENVLISVWRQVLVEKAERLTLNGETYPVRRTSRSKLREVEFELEGVPVHGVEQNASTASRWAKLAREGKTIMQFLNDGRYLGNVVDGKLTAYQALHDRFPGRSQAT